jgi:LysM repeat protein
MNNPMRKFRKFFVKPKKMNATAVRNAAASSYDEETDDTKLSGAFIIVLILHIVAVVGIVAFTRIKKNRENNEPVANAVVPAKEKKSAAAPMTVAGINSTKAAQLAPEIPDAGATVVENDPPKILPSTGSIIHTVKPGETLTKIALAFGTTVADIARVNGLKDTGDITSGTVLNIPAKSSLPPLPPVVERRSDVKTTPPKPVTSTPAKATAQPAKTSPQSGTSYTIKKGDSLMKIAREHSVEYKDLVNLNKGVDPKKIQPGQTLKIPRKN